MFLSGALVPLTLVAASVVARPVADTLGRKVAARAQAAASAAPRAWQGPSAFASAGKSGVSAMQLVVVDDNTVLIYDKQLDARPNFVGPDREPVWASTYAIDTAQATPLAMQTDSFCAGGGWLGNGTMVSVGGTGNNLATSGWDGLRIFTPQSANGTGLVYEDPTRLRLTSKRWYPSTTRLEDGSVIIFGGMSQTGFTNSADLNKPTLEFWPPKFDGRETHSKFLVDSLNTNLFPVTFLLPSGDIFVAANTLAMIYNWRTNTETRLPALPNRVAINYPATAASALLPLTIANNWTAEVLLCGGTTADVSTDSDLSANSPASAQCSRIRLDESGIAAGWQVEEMPEARLMGDAILTPDGQVLIINGAGTGQAGFSNVQDGSAVGDSNAANPVYHPTLYSPLAAEGQRFWNDFPSSKIERMYHSSASMVPDGRIIVAGSNPNNGFNTTTYVTRYDVEMFSPPYLNTSRPSYTGLPTNLAYGAPFGLEVTLPANTTTVQAVLMDLGYSTHGVHMSQRWVELTAALNGSSLVVNAPATAGLFPPGPGWVHILADGIPSEAKKVMVGDGADPPFSEEAMQGLLATPVAN